jgi:hypothetical protein
MATAAAATVRGVFSARDGEDGEEVIHPAAFAGSDVAEYSDELDPYGATAAGLEEAMLQAQLNRLNQNDRIRVRKHLGLVPNGPIVASEDPHAGEKALAKMRHPSVARVWRLRAPKPAPDQSAG